MSMNTSVSGFRRHSMSTRTSMLATDVGDEIVDKFRCFARDERRAPVPYKLCQYSGTVC